MANFQFAKRDLKIRATVSRSKTIKDERFGYVFDLLTMDEQHMKNPKGFGNP